MRKISILLLNILTFSICVFGQTYDGEYMYIYHYQQPDSRSEAMGKIQGALYDSPLSSLYNPASGVFNKGLNFSYNHLKPQFYYDYNEAKHDIYSISLNLKKYGAVALCYRYFTYGPVFVTSIYNPDGNSGRYTPGIYIYTLNYSIKLLNDISAGFNANNFIDKQTSKQNENAWIFDFGIMKSIDNFTETYNQKIILSGSVSNITNASIESGSAFMNAEEGIHKTHFPSTLRIGAAYEYESKLQLSGYEIFKAMSALEYNDPLNTKLFTSYKAGAEITLFEMLKLRMGYSNEKINDNTVDGNIENLSEFTYGFGLNLPLNKITERTIPFEIQIDYVNLPAPSYSSIMKIDKKYSSISIGVKIIP